MKSFFKLYIFFVIILAVGFLTYFLFTQPFHIDLPAIIFMFITIFLEYSNLLDERNSLYVSLTGCSYIFLTINYGVYPSVIAYIMALFFNKITKNKETLKMLELKKRYHGQQEKISHKNHILRLLFNISKQIIITSTIYYSSTTLKISNISYVDIWKIALIYIIMFILDFLITILVMVLNTNKFPKNLMSTKIIPLIFYDIIICILLIYSYSDRGIIGALLVYLILFPLQKTTLMYYKVKIQEEELYSDSLTHAYNKRFLENLLVNKLMRKEPFSIIMLDLDKFKQINDTFGHLAGDKVLIEFSKNIRKKAGKNNYFCRYAGDEFIIFISNPYEVDDMANQILNIFDNFAVDYEGHKISILLSIGIYRHLDDEEEDMADIIKKADKAMYYSKRKGSNIITHYDDL